MAGDWVEGKKDGHGCYTYKNGDVYQGYWLKDRRAGQGKYFFKGASCSFEGVWKDGHFLKGDWVMRDGGTYQGQFFDGKPINEGAFVFNSGNVQRCSWKIGDQDENPTWTMKAGAMTTLPVYAVEQAAKAAEEARKEEEERKVQAEQARLKAEAEAEEERIQAEARAAAAAAAEAGEE